jgi:GTPase SAR1 family protein
MPPKDIDANMTPQETAPSSPTDVQPPRNEVTTAKSSLEDLQTEEQRNVLDTVARVRKCGLESEISLPQLVVCGAQSAGKSSVLEALTEIPFPRNEQLCTRFPTEIHLRRGPTTALTITVIPGKDRSEREKAAIKAFQHSTTDLAELPSIMDAAMDVMGITKSGSGFSKDTLSIVSERPTNPQLTLVDIPGLIGTATKGTHDDDIPLVAAMTQHYISKPRTICLAVVSAAVDYATQDILKRVQDVDPKGVRTLGIITKPDRVDGAGSKQAFLELARNQDIVFKLGWHVLKNRDPEETSAGTSLDQRKESETKWFKEHFMSALPTNMVGIDSLRRRLSLLLFQHVKRELPQLRLELEALLESAESELNLMGRKRATPQECKEYLSQLSLEFYEVTKSAVEGHYEGTYFHQGTELEQDFDISSPGTYCRTRAVVQYLNTEFSNKLRLQGHKYIFSAKGTEGGESGDEDEETEDQHISQSEGDYPMDGDGDEIESRSFSSSLEGDEHKMKPVRLNRDQALQWVHHLLVRTRGKELLGNFNPLLIGELFWEQSSKWEKLASAHVEQVAHVVSNFLQTLLKAKCASDVHDRVWESMEEKLKTRKDEADRELQSIMEDLQSYPINYNHYYTDTIHKRRQERQKAILAACIERASSSTPVPGCQHNAQRMDIDLDKVVAAYSTRSEADMEKFSCEEALDCLFAIYKVGDLLYLQYLFYSRLFGARIQSLI